MKEYAVVSFNFPAMLAQLTGTQRRHWQEIDGPASRCGLDYWYRHKITGEEVNINLDQGHLSIFSLEAEETLFAGLYTEFPGYQRFIDEC